MTVWSLCRGQSTEVLIDATNDYYEMRGLCLVNKIPTPIKVLRIARGKITLGYFEKKSTVDYNGVVQGYPIAFDAKETTRKSLPLSNIQDHQIEYLTKFRKQKGIGFFIINYKLYNRFVFLPIETLLENIGKENIQKSIPYSMFGPEWHIELTPNGYLDYLSTLNMYIKRNIA